MRSKQPSQSGRNSSPSTFSFLRNVLVGMVFFEPIPKEVIEDRIQRSDIAHAASVSLHEKSQAAIAASDKLIYESRLDY